MTNSQGCLQQRRGSDCSAAQSDACLYLDNTRCIGLQAKRHLMSFRWRTDSGPSKKNFCTNTLTRLHNLIH